MNKVLQFICSFQPRQIPLVWLLLLFLLLTACFGGGDNVAQDGAPEAAVQQTGSLTCSDNCRNQGQCGTAADGRNVILAHSSKPATRDHDAVLENDSPIFIVGTEQRTVSDPITGNTTILNFFAVQPVGGGFINWVAGSCVNVTVQQ